MPENYLQLTEPALNSVPIYILAGGRSSRFGSDKARILVQGQPLLLRLAQTLRPIASSLTVVADLAEKYLDLGLRTIPDRIAGLGPVGGISTALHDVSEEGWLLVTACDLIDMNPAWIKLLLSRIHDRVQAVAFKGERWESLPALFRTSIRPAVEEKIASRQFAIWQLLEQLATQAVALPDDWKNLFHINTPQDLAAYQKRVRRSKI